MRARGWGSGSRRTTATRPTSARLRAFAVVAASVGVVAAGCSSTGTGSPPTSSGAALATVSGTSAGTTAGTTRGTTAGTTSGTSAAVWTATVVAEHDVNPGLRQGLAHDEGAPTWVLSTNNALYRTDATFNAVPPPGDKLDPAIPSSLAADSYNHIGDIDITGGVLWAPIEKDDKDAGQQVIARYDAKTLAFRDSFVVAQHHAAFVTVDADGVVWSADGFSDDTLLRYRVQGATLERLPPLKMGTKVERIQGGDIADGAMWLSTDDDHDGLYRVDLATGAVQDVGSAGHADGEGEGDDARAGDGGSVELAVLAADVKLVPMRVVQLRATATSSR